MKNYAMVIDLNKCIRCRTCYVACKNEHHILAHPRDAEHPREYYRLRYIEWEWGTYPRVRRAYIPLFCMQCTDPLCRQVCPADAIVIREDGIKVIDQARCNGCGVCTHACPYGALYLTPGGRADGCDFCANRLDAGHKPRCVAECPSSEATILFGNLDDPKSAVGKLVRSGNAKPILFGGIQRTKLYYIPSPNIEDWDRLPYDNAFLNALARRNRDLPPIQGIH